MHNKLVIFLLLIIIILVGFISYTLEKQSSLDEHLLSLDTKKDIEANNPPKENKTLEGGKTSSGDSKDNNADSGDTNGGDVPKIPDITNPDKKEPKSVGDITSPEDNGDANNIVGTIQIPTKGGEGAICSTNNDCSIDLYCKKEGVNSCTENIKGICTTKPAGVIPCGIKYDPVCGCNQKTYSNACHAAKAGVNVAKTEECS